MLDLMAKGQWVYWQYELRDGKQTKVPKDAHTGYNAKSNDPTTWSFYHEVVGKGDGAGFMFTEGLAGIDIDAHDVDQNPLALEILDLFKDTYIEHSPSGKGYHIIFRVDPTQLPVTPQGKWDSEHYYMKNSKIDVECYVGGFTNRFFTFTQDMTSDDGNITDMTAQFVYFLNKYMRKKGHIMDMAIIDKAAEKDGYQFTSLFYDHDLSAYDNDESRADLALCNRLAYWFRGDEQAINEAFRASSLYREKWERDDYSHNTIQKAIDGLNGKFYRPVGRPRGSESEPRKPYLTIETFADELAERGIVIRFNDITQEIEIEGSDLNQQHILENLPTHLYSEIQGTYRNATKKNIIDYIRYTAFENAYNPVIEFFKGKKWDGKHRFNDIYAALGIENDQLSQTLVYKWFWQGITLLHNTYEHHVQPEGVLTLAGPQGIGKTTFFRKVAVLPEFFKDGQTISSRDKDPERRAVTTWISELGELDCTFKSDMGYLKGFLTRDFDRYRLPYGATDENVPRRTNLGATVNGTEFLIDPTGNRRYWTIPLVDINRDALDVIEWEQVWLEVWENGAREKPNGFRLDRDQQNSLADRNRQCEKPLEGEELIQGILENGREWDFITMGEFMEAHNLKGRLTDKKVGAVLNKLGYPKKSVRGYDGKVRKLRELPRR